MENLKKEKYLIACSGGPDSMALLAMMKDKYSLMVCHINYHHRQSAKRDENIVNKYCKQYKLPFVKFDYEDNKGGNFQDKARVFRYQCFKNVVEQNNLTGVMVAHHMDDLLETYFLQKERKGNVSYYGLKKETIIQGIKVIRPLLKYQKKDLENYCVENNIPFGIDESNLTNVYKRNKLRHEKIEKLSLKEKKNILKEINLLNKNKKIIDTDVKKFINKRQRIPLSEFLSYQYQKEVLRYLIVPSLSDKHLQEIIKALKTNKNIELHIKDKVLYKEYGYFEVWPQEKNYLYLIKKIEYKKYPNFELKKKGDNFSGVTVTKDDFPLTIRNYQEGDFIKMRYGTKKINRFFIDNKISTHQRKQWPIMLNKKGTAILVPKIGCNFNHYSDKHNVYMIKLS